MGVDFVNEAPPPLSRLAYIRAGVTGSRCHRL
jgi:hypothetical protein